MNTQAIEEMSAPQFHAYARSLGVVNMVVGQLGGAVRARADTEAGGAFYGSGRTLTAALADVLAQVRARLS